MNLSRRSFLTATGAVTVSSLLAKSLRAQTPPPPASPPKPNGKHLLFFTRSQDFPHAAVTRQNGEPLAWGERLLQQWAQAAGYTIDITKDGTIFTPEKIAQTDAFIFYTTGDLTQPAGTRFKGSDTTPAMSPESKTALLNAIHGGKGFVGIHCATDTFHSKSTTHVLRSPAGDEVDPYIAMLGGEFLAHGSQQIAKIHFADPTFAGAALKDFEANEEWYSLVNIAPDLHVIAVQQTDSMKTNPAGKREWQYQRAPYPETWARLHGTGRVFYTSMGHRQDIWEGDIFQKLLMAGISWTAGLADAAATPNLQRACPNLETDSPTSQPAK